MLAGLLDTDGHLQKEFNCFEITQKNETLAKQIEFLCNTLGFKVSFHAKQATIKDRNFECTVYRVRISGDIDRVPTKVPYKQARPKSMRRNHLNVGITIEKDIVDDYYGFVIDGNSRYLHGDCTVTHNTLIALQIALENTSRGVPIGFFSLEMTKKMIMERLLSYMCRIPMHKIRSRNVSNRELEFAQENVEKIKSLDLIIDPKSHLTPQQFISRARRMKMQYKDLGLICVDYLQLMSAPGVKESREKEIAYIAQTLKRVAIDLDIPVIGVSQLSRAVEQRENKRPILSDLRESGAIEQISDIVMFMYRPGYYSGDKTDHSAEIIVAKNRNGPTGRVELTEELVIQRFTEE